MKEGENHPRPKMLREGLSWMFQLVYVLGLCFDWLAEVYGTCSKSV